MSLTLRIALTAALALCIVTSAVLAVAEVALIRVRRSSVVVEAERGDRAAIRLLGLLDQLPIVLNSVLLFVLLFQVGAATIASYLANDLFGGLGVTIASIALTGLLFVYAEAIPKTLAVRSSQRFALRLTPMIAGLVWLVRPLVSSLVRMAALQSGKERRSTGAATEPELRAMARESAAVGEIEKGDAALVERSFEFGDRQVREVMVPRAQMTTVRHDDLVTLARDRALESGHRRMPVVGAATADILGFVRLRDLVATATQNPTATTESLILPVQRCGADHPVASLLRDMQRSAQWLAIVHDGDGDPVGMATMEDLVAELVGEVADERAVVNRFSTPPEADG
ncbi:MAG: DUF21 domain-containing protein [Acidimicrobiales bacterium]|nr:DUF21 domain-containing protein [Acidimicrobiales bacterium]